MNCTRGSHNIVPKNPKNIETGRPQVTGRNATGKTTLIRVISGLWPHTKGELTAPKPAGASVPGLKDVFVVPQRIHMVSHG